MKSKIFEIQKAKKKVEDHLHKLENIYFPKIKRTSELQKEIIEQLNTIRQDSELLPQMFRNLAQEKESSRLAEEKARD